MTVFYLFSFAKRSKLGETVTCFARFRDTYNKLETVNPTSNECTSSWERVQVSLPVYTTVTVVYNTVKYLRHVSVTKHLVV